MELLELKSRFQYPVWKKLFCKKLCEIETGELVSTAYKRHI